MEPVPPEVHFAFAVPGAGQSLRQLGEEAPAALNVAVHGARRWFVLPPDRAETSSVPALLYAAHVLPRLPAKARPLQCDQRAGDVVFIPRRWAAGWLAVETGAGYEVRFASPLDRY
jgi:hypothetical protein